jgi:hypothetical protein
VEKLEDCTLLVRINNGAAAMENSLEVPQKINIDYHVIQHFHFYIGIDAKELKLS